MLPRISFAEVPIKTTQVNALKTPLLDLAIQTKNDILAGHINRVTDIIPDINWQDDDIYKMQARKYTSNGSVLCDLTLVSAAAKNMIYYAVRGKSYILHYDFDEVGQIYLISNRLGPLAYNKPRAHSVSELLTPSIIVQLHPVNKSLSIKPSLDNLPDTSSQIFVFDNPKKHTVTLQDLLTGKEVAEVPRVAYGLTDFRQINNKIVGGGIEWHREKGTNNFLWGKYSHDTKKWEMIKREINPTTYLKQLLPLELQQMQPQFTDSNLREKIAPDGSIIFRIAANLRKKVPVQKGIDQLRFVGLVKQPQKGHAKLLAWALYHSYSSFQFTNGDSAESYKTMNKNSAKQPFPEVWYPTENKKIESHSIRTNDNNDFLFDIDDGNDIAIFLLQGKLWSVKLTGE